MTFITSPGMETNSPVRWLRPGVDTPSAELGPAASVEQSAPTTVSRVQRSQRLRNALEFLASGGTSSLFRD